MAKLLLAGAWQYEVYERACADALKRLGIEVVPFKWARFFSSLPGRAEAKYVYRGPFTIAMNRAFVACAQREQPDYVLVWRGTHVLRKTVRALRNETTAVLASYNNDDPFGPLYRNSPLLHQRRLWRNFVTAIPEYDLHFVYRQLNIAEFIRAGAKRARLLRSYYIPALHRPVVLNQEEQARFGCDAVFIGHYEPHRLEFIRALVDAGLKVRIFGRESSWTAERLGSLVGRIPEVHPAFGEEYVKAICGAKLCLCFFSRLNRDSYTRRSFEIPACGGLLLSERTEEMESLFQEDAEAIYFSAPDELVSKAVALLHDEQRRREISNAGRRRAERDGHSVDARMRYAIEQMQGVEARRT